MNEALDALESMCQKKDRRKTIEGLILAVIVVFLTMFFGGFVGGLFSI